MSAEGELVYSVSASLGHAHSGRGFGDRSEAIRYAEGLRADGWTVSIAIYGAVDGFELWRTLTRPEAADQ